MYIEADTMALAFAKKEEFIVTSTSKETGDTDPICLLYLGSGVSFMG